MPINYLLKIIGKYFYKNYIFSVNESLKIADLTAKSFENISIVFSENNTGELTNYMFQGSIKLPFENISNFGAINLKFPEEVILINGTTNCTAAIINLVNGT